MTGRATRRPPGRGATGFTLIELLVALTLVGLISVVLFGGLRFGTRAWEAGDARVEQVTEVQAAQSLLRRRLVQARLPGRTPAAVIESEASFRGERDRLRFLALVPERVGVGGFYRFELSVAEADGESQLMLAWRLYRADAPGRLLDLEPGLGGERVLIAGFERADIAYFGPDRAGGPADWRDTWSEAAGLPELVSIDLAFAAGDPRRWPRLVIAPKLSGPGP